MTLNEHKHEHEFEPDHNQDLNNNNNNHNNHNNGLHHRGLDLKGIDSFSTRTEILQQLRKVTANGNVKSASPAFWNPYPTKEEEDEIDLIESTNQNYTYKWSEIVWPMVIKISLLHLLSFHGLYLGLAGLAKWQTVYFTIVLGVISAFGTTAGAHRLWTHRSYKATVPLRAFLAYLFSMTLQYNLHDWARDHRVHHKYTETNADPHNAHRGFFFSHIGWLMLRKHPDVVTQGKTIDVSDVAADPVVQFQKRYFIACVLFAWGVVPTIVPHLLWGETYWNAFFLCAALRSVVVLHYTFMINSVAHMWGNRPFNERIGARDSKPIAHFTMGEGYHNYHHTFPWDYSTAELGFAHTNMTTGFIDAFAAIGWAYDLKRTTPTVVEARKKKNGDGLPPLGEPGKPLKFHDYIMPAVYFLSPVWMAYLLAMGIGKLRS